MNDARSTRTLIVSAAAKLFAADGYDAVSMRDVAAEVSMTPANIYYHFKDKDALIRETLVHVLSTPAPSLQTILATTQSPHDVIDAFIDSFAHTMFEDRIFSKLVLRELLDGDVKRLKYVAETVVNDPFSAVTRAVAACGGGGDPVLMTASIISIIIGHFQIAAMISYVPGGTQAYADPRVVSRHISVLVRNALKAWGSAD